MRSDMGCSMAPKTSGVPSGRADPCRPRPAVRLDGRVHRLFVYGTLQHEPLLDHLLGRAPDLRAARLPGWRAAALRGRVYPGLVPAPGGSAPGALIEVDDAELEVLDRFEGPQYRRIEVLALVDGRAGVDASRRAGVSRERAVVRAAAHHVFRGCRRDGAWCTRRPAR